jgi:hypothetical protein
MWGLLGFNPKHQRVRARITDQHVPEHGNLPFWMQTHICRFMRRSCLNDLANFVVKRNVEEDNDTDL